MRLLGSAVGLEGAECLPSDIGKGPFRTVEEAGESEGRCRPVGEPVAGGPHFLDPGRRARGSGANRNERHHVGRAQPGVYPDMVPQVDPGHRRPDHGAGSILDGVDRAAQCHHRAMVLGISVQIEQGVAGRFGQGGDDQRDRGPR